MDALNNLCREARSQGLPWILVGGHAVAQHGYGRTTEDVDLLICRVDAPRWHELAVASGYSLFHEAANFSQWTQPAGGTDAALDFMIVNAETFAKLRGGASPSQILGQEMLIPSLDHLLALKFHALRGNTSLRVMKDMDDVIQLLAINRVDVTQPAFRELVLKFGDEAIYEKLRSVFKNQP